MTIPRRHHRALPPFMVLCLAGVFLWSGCSGEVGLAPTGGAEKQRVEDQEPFEVTIRLVDEQGQPVAGQALGLGNKLPFPTPGPHAARSRAQVAIPFRVPVEAQVRISVEDILGQEVRLLVDGYLAAGQHLVVWNGRDTEGRHLPHGRYTVRLQGQEDPGREISYEETVDIYMWAFAPSQYTVGVTDEDGCLVLTDLRLFPHLFERDPMVRTDEDAQQLGLFQLNHTMILQPDGPWPWSEFKVAHGLNEWTFVLPSDGAPRGEGILRTVQRDQAVHCDQMGKTSGCKVLDAGAGRTDPIPIEWQLGAPYPNPFN